MKPLPDRVNKILENIRIAAEIISLAESVITECSKPPSEGPCAGCMGSLIVKSVFVSQSFLPDLGDFSPDENKMYGVMVATLALAEFPEAMSDLTSVLREAPEFLLGLEVARRYMEKKHNVS